MPIPMEALKQRASALWSQLQDEVRNATTEELLFKPGDRWSARDTLVHIGNWMEEGVTNYRVLLAGGTPPSGISQPIDEWNAEHLAKYAHLDMAGVMEYLDRQHQALEEIGAQLTDEQLAASPRFMGLFTMTPNHVDGHICQIREALALARGDYKEAGLQYLAYARRRLLIRLELENRSTAALTWRPAEGKWCFKEHMLHLSIWDRHWVAFFDDIAEGREARGWPCSREDLDRWNQEQVAALAWMNLAEAIHEYGEARGALIEHFRRLAPEQVRDERVQERLTKLRKHDNHHMYQFFEILRGWQKATA